MAQLRVAVFDDHRLALDAIAAALEGDARVEVVGSAHDPRKVLPVVARVRPDLVLLDVKMPYIDGLSLLDRLRRAYPEIQVAMISGTDDPDIVRAAEERGASAFVLKHIPPQELAAAVVATARSRVYRVFGAPSEAAPEPLEHLTAREAEMLRSLALGRSNKQIARDLWVSEQTVKFHLTNLYRKLGVTTRTGAIRYAYQLGLVDTSGGAGTAQATPR
jgi:DNA-binding NarL/FixJ family response regulator